MFSRDLLYLLLDLFLSSPKGTSAKNSKRSCVKKQIRQLAQQCLVFYDASIYFFSGQTHCNCVYLLKPIKNVVSKGMAEEILDGGTESIFRSVNTRYFLALG